MKRTSWSLCLTAMTIAGLPAPAAAQKDAARRARAEPELIVHTDGRTGACDVLAFTRDGRHLLAAGDDKVLRVWPLRNGRIVKEGARSLRWQIWREQRGSIFAAALDAEEKRVAMAGYGAITGAVVILNFATGEVLASTPNHTDSVVWSVAFSPSGKQVAFGKDDGTVWVWDLARKHVRSLGAHAQGKNKPRVRWVGFQGNDQLMSAGSDGSVIRWDLAKGQGVIAFRFARKNLVCIAASSDGKWLAAGSDGQKANPVELRSLDGKQSKQIDLPSGFHPLCLAFSKDATRLAIGAYQVPDPRPFWKITDGAVYLATLKGQAPKAVRGPQTTAWPQAVAFHPEGKLLGVAGGANHEVALWRVDGRASKVNEVVGPGRCLWGVGLSPDGKQVGFQAEREANPAAPNARGKGPWRVFDLHTQQWADSAAAGFDKERVRPILRANGWSIEPDPQVPRRWYAVNENLKVRNELELDARQDHHPICFTFLPGGGNKAPRVAVGHYWGVSIFELTAARARRIRLLTGHHGEVTSVAPSKDGKALVTASSDQTLAGWSLVDWPSGNELGAKFKDGGGKVVVERVDAGSPAWEMGLSKGDEILLFSYAGTKLLYDPGRRWSSDRHRAYETVGKINDCLDRLGRPIPGQEFYMEWRRPGEPGALIGLTTIRQRPLWRFFPSFDRPGPPEWVLWLWHSFDYATSTRGDYHIGWQVNSGIGRAPRFYRAEQFRRRFHNPKKVFDALTGVAALDRPSLLRIEPPELRLVVPDLEVSAEGLPVKLTIKPRGSLAEQQVGDVALWINDYRYPDLKLKGTGEQTLSLTLPAALFRHGANQVALQCSNADINRQRARAEAPRVLVTKREGTAPKSRLYILTIGVDNYSRVRKIINRSSPRDLTFPVNDTEAIAELWGKQRGGLFAEVKVIHLHNSKATRTTILGELANLAKLVKDRPDDRVIVYFSGHGFAQPVSLKPPLYQPGTYAFCTYDFDPGRRAQTGVSAGDIAEKLASLNARKLVLIDTCHSGGVSQGSSDAVREMTPHDVGPVILSASGFHQEAQESPKLGQGVFTFALMEAVENFSKVDRNRDGQLDITEIVDYLNEAVPRLCREVKVPIHHPVAYHPGLEAPIHWLTKKVR